MDFGCQKTDIEGGWTGLITLINITKTKHTSVSEYNDRIAESGDTWETKSPIVSVPARELVQVNIFQHHQTNQTEQL